MKKASKIGGTEKTVRNDEILPEYDFRRGIKNKYAARFARGSAVVVIEPDVARVFRTAREVNEALRAIAGIMVKRRR